MQQTPPPMDVDTKLFDRLALGWKERRMGCERDDPSHLDSPVREPGVFARRPLFMNLTRTYFSFPGLQKQWAWGRSVRHFPSPAMPVGTCPAGGLHDHTGSCQLTTFLIFSVLLELLSCGSAGGPARTTLRWCNKCQSLSFARNASVRQMFRRPKS